MKHKTLFLFATILLGFSAISAQTRETKTISGGVVNGKAVSLPAPESPAAARAVGAGGTVSVQVLIDETGNVISAKAVSGHPLLRSAAEKAALEAKFSPTLHSGNAVRVSGIIVYAYDSGLRQAAPGSGEPPDYKGKTIVGGVVNGKALALPKPEYPAAAAALGAGGSVNVRVLIDEEGNVISADADSGHPLLRSASEAAARQARFAPTTLSGVPVKVSGHITYVFEAPPKAESAEESYDVDLVGLGAGMRIMTRLNSDPRLDTVSNIFFDGIGKGLDQGEIPAEMSGIAEIPKASSTRRAEILADLEAKFRIALEGDQVWQYAVGDIVGGLIAESWKRAALRETDAAYYRVNLQKLKDQMNSVPPGFPAELRIRLIKVAEFGDKPNLEDEFVLADLEKKLDVLSDILLDSEDQE